MQMGARPTEWRWLLYAGCGEASDYFSSFVMGSITLSCGACSYGRMRCDGRKGITVAKIAEATVGPLYDLVPPVSHQMTWTDRVSHGFPTIGARSTARLPLVVSGYHICTLCCTRNQSRKPFCHSSWYQTTARFSPSYPTP